MLCDKKGREILTGDEAAKRFGVSAGYIRTLYQKGELKRVVESPRRVFYYVSDVQRIMDEKAKSRKKRGGRPRSGPTAA